MNIDNLNSRIKQCKACTGLNQKATPEKEATLNAPGYGDITSKVLIIGQSLCGDPCINSQIPFTGGCGVLLDEAFDKCGVRKKQLYITNIVKCHPPKNSKSISVWIKNCSHYLTEELSFTSPKVIICLGKDSGCYFDKNSKFGTNKVFTLNNNKIIVHFLYHPSYIQNRRPQIEREPYINSIANIIRPHYAL